MSKALYVYRGCPDPRLAAELAALRSRVRELEAEVAVLRGAGDEAQADLEMLVPDPALV